MASIFNIFFEEVTFAQFQGEVELLANEQDEFKVFEQDGQDDGIQQNIVNNHAVAGGFGVRVTGFEKVISLGTRGDVLHAGI